ncbi:hypothetical protein Vretifemale_15989 [Volvox reticuliferus]|uniref:Uncharacterized protein n=1 Tax=Volvox reticuliferus TaxID=1737510 RepID=A0A8J4CQI6_9CHLO|nr:hypothetical protein Vretifemale_15989 [Volvox reticuliferus]
MYVCTHVRVGDLSYNPSPSCCMHDRACMLRATSLIFPGLWLRACVLPAGFGRSPDRSSTQQGITISYAGSVLGAAAGEDRRRRQIMQVGAATTGQPAGTSPVGTGTTTVGGGTRAVGPLTTSTSGGTAVASRGGGSISGAGGGRRRRQLMQGPESAIGASAGAGTIGTGASSLGGGGGGVGGTGAGVGRRRRRQLMNVGAPSATKVADSNCVADGKAGMSSETIDVIFDSGVKMDYDDHDSGGSTAGNDVLQRHLLQASVGPSVPTSEPSAGGSYVSGTGGLGAGAAAGGGARQGAGGVGRRQLLQVPRIEPPTAPPSASVGPSVPTGEPSAGGSYVSGTGGPGAGAVAGGGARQGAGGVGPVGGGGGIGVSGVGGGGLGRRQLLQ